MEKIQNLIAGILISVTAYLQPISGEMQGLLGLFFFNFCIGLLAAIVANESFSFRKAWRCICEAAIFFLLVGAICFIGERKGNAPEALQCISFVTYIVVYFYAMNILRNLMFIFPDNSAVWKVTHFLHYILSVEFVKKIPGLQNYINKTNEHENEPERH